MVFDHCRWDERKCFLERLHKYNGRFINDVITKLFKGIELGDDERQPAALQLEYDKP